VQGLVAGLNSVGVDAWLFTLKKRGEPWVSGIKNYRTADCEGAKGVREAVEEIIDKIRPDLVQIRSLWQLSMHQACVAARRKKVPYILTPRGCLDVWSLKQKWLKKKIALLTYQGYDLRRAAAIHTTAEEETRQVRRLGFRQVVLQFPNGVNFPESLPPRERTDKRRMIFLSRMHKKKGLVELVEAWAKVMPKEWQCELVFTLNGDEEKAYESKIKGMVEQLGLVEDFIFTGKLLDEEKWQAYRRSDCFILPTYTENFGIVIAEALYAGLPVITTQGAPWRDLIDHQCGWWVKQGDVNALANALIEATQMSRESLEEMGARGQRLVIDKYHWNKICMEMCTGYKKLLSF
jgi:glycosyltransferase involved in cell wall biosynthesis